MKVKGEPLSTDRTYDSALSLYKHVCMYHYPFIMGIKCHYCQCSKSLMFSNSSAYANVEELWKYVVARHSHNEDAQRFTPIQ